MISKDRKYKAFGSQRNIPVEILFGKNRTSKLDIPVLHVWLQKNKTTGEVLQIHI